MTSTTASTGTTMNRPLWVARLRGTQAEMGAQHGRLAAVDARALLAFYRTLPERALAGDLPGVLGAVGRRVVRTLADAWEARLSRDRPAELAARARAFVDAAGADGAVALRSFAVMDALQNCVSLAARGGLGPFHHAVVTRAGVAAVPACSSVIAWGAATADGELMFARNFDFPGIGTWDAAPAFIVCEPDRGQRYGFFTTRGADTPVVTVVNEAGLVFAPHTRWHRGVGWSGAMIVDLVHDLARRAETLADAIAIARERPASSSWGIAVGSGRERSAVVLEIAGGAFEVVRPAAGADYLVCANRYRSAALQAGEVAASTAWAIQSERRERRLRQLVETRSAPLVARDLIAMLGDRSDVDAPAARRRLGGIVAQPGNVHAAVVAPTSQRAWVGVDRAPCCEGQWAELAWQWSGPIGGWDSPAAAPAGFAITTRDDLAAPQDAATRHLRDAVRVYEDAHDLAAARTAIERACAADPDDPSLQLAAALLAGEAGADDRAIVHVHAGLAREADPYRRGQLLLWGSRAAATRDPALATRWLHELAALHGDGIDELQAAARRRGRPHPNLLMLDAF